MARRDGEHYVHHRPQAVHQQRARGLLRAGLRPDRPGQGPPRDHRLRRREGHAGLHGVQDRGQARHPRLRHRRAGVRGVPGAGRQPHRRGGAGLQDRADRDRRRADRHRRPGGRHRRRRLRARRWPTRASARRSASPIGQHQMVQWMLADMATAIDGGRLLCLQAAALKDRGAPFTRQAAMAKLFCAETAMKVTTDAIQVHGGYGFIKDYEVERYFRDAKITQLYEGTSQIQKLVIAREVLRGDHDGDVSAGAASARRGSRSLSGIPVEPLYTPESLGDWSLRRASSAVRASTRSRAASIRRCTAGGSGRCGCSPASDGPRTRTPASSTCWPRGRPGSPRPSTCRR